VYIEVYLSQCALSHWFNKGYLLACLLAWIALSMLTRSGSFFLFSAVGNSMLVGGNFEYRWK